MIKTSIINQNTGQIDFETSEGTTASFDVSKILVEKEVEFSGGTVKGFATEGGEGEFLPIGPFFASVSVDPPGELEVGTTLEVILPLGWDADVSWTDSQEQEIGTGKTYTLKVEDFPGSIGFSLTNLSYVGLSSIVELPTLPE